MMPKRAISVDVSVVGDRNATVAEVIAFHWHAPGRAASIPTHLGAVTGSAKREQGDVYDEGIAIDLAVGRALVKLGHQMQRRGRAQVERATKADNRARVLHALRAGRLGEKPYKRLSLDEITSKYGAEAAARAVERRGRHRTPRMQPVQS